MLNRRDLVVALRVEYLVLNRYDTYLRSMFFRTCPGVNDFIKRHFTGVEETIDIVVDHMEELSVDQLDHAQRTLLEGQEIDLSGKNVGGAIKETAYKAYVNYLENMLCLELQAG